MSRDLHCLPVEGGPLDPRSGAGEQNRGPVTMFTPPSLTSELAAEVEKLDCETREKRYSTPGRSDLLRRVAGHWARWAHTTLPPTTLQVVARRAELRR